MNKQIVLTVLAFAAILIVTGLLLLPSRTPEADAAGRPPLTESRGALVAEAAHSAEAQGPQEIVIPATSVPPREYPGTGIKTYGPNEALIEARKTGKHAILYFWATWCGNCAAFDANVLPDKAVAETLNSSFALAPLDYDRSEEIVRMFRIRAVPTFIFIDPDGKPATVLPGAVPAEVFAAVLAYVSTGSYKSMEFDEFAVNL